MKKPIMLMLACLIGCQETQKADDSSENKMIQFELINYYLIDQQVQEIDPYMSRVTYYFDNGLLHRWIERDSLDRLTTDYIVEYDDNWIQTGAKYIELEAGEPFNGSYEVERVKFSGDTLKTTEWLDSAGNVYYQMVENLNEFGLPDRAAFIGEKLHGYDSSYYTSQGFEKRIFFRNTKGKTYNDRSFKYTALNDQGDWIEREKLTEDTVRELQKRQILYYGDDQIEGQKYYDGVISTLEDENVISFNQDEDVVFFTRGTDWLQQFGFIAEKKNGIFVLPAKMDSMDTIYNGAISPSGNKILYSKRLQESTEIWLIEKQEDNWSSAVNLSMTKGLEGGYFNWYDENEIYFYIPENEGDLVVGTLQNKELRILSRLDEFNTEATEFSPFMAKDKSYFIFTRYAENDEARQGFFISYNEGVAVDPKWTMPVKIEALPYGWGAFVSADQKLLYYTDGVDIYNVQISKLNIKLN